MFRASLLLVIAAALAGPALAQPTVTREGYVLDEISNGVPSEDIVQLAFRPGDDIHLFALQRFGTILRYDYDAGTGQLANALLVADGLGDESMGLAFHGDDLYVSLDLGGSLTERPGDGRITRLSQPDSNGVYQLRHDFVHSIPKGNHDVNQLQIRGDSLWVGIGAVGRIGDPAEENVYAMTLARIADLTLVDFSGPIDADFKGPVNYLANETDWLDGSVADGKLRYYASGFRNPFGIAIDDDGEPWVSSNGNSDDGFESLDYLYRKVPPGGQGVFPPESFGFGPPDIRGAPIEPLAVLGQNPSPTGFDFVPGGPDRGKVVLAQAGATNQNQFPVGKDVLLVDPDSGEFAVLIDDMVLPTDVVRDPLGRLLISDLQDGSVWLLTPPTPMDPAGRISDDEPLTVARTADGTLTLGWGPSCQAGDGDYIVYVGTLGNYYDHTALACSTGGALTTTFASPRGNAYYLVVPRTAAHQGSHGLRSSGAERTGKPDCELPQAIAVCP